jgi:nucleoside-diphosphate-sugar epimerase
LRDLPVEILSVDLTDIPSLRSSLAGIAYLFHIAGRTKARTGAQFLHDNVTVTRALLRAATAVSGLRKFCHVSSLTAVGPSPDGLPVTEQTPPSPITAYGFSKLEAEKACHAFSHELPIVIIRPPAVYGPRDRDVLEMFRWIRRGIAPIMGPREKTLSLLHVHDLARGLLTAALDERTTGETYFITDGIRHSYEDLIAIISRLLNTTPRFLPIPSPLVYAAACVSECISWFGSRPPVLNLDKVRDLLAAHWTCSSERFERLTGFVPSVPIEAGLEATLAWYRHHRWL